MEENRMRRHTVIDPHRQTPYLQVDLQQSELDEENISIVTPAFDRLHGQLRLEFCSISIIIDIGFVHRCLRSAST